LNKGARTSRIPKPAAKHNVQMLLKQLKEARSEAAEWKHKCQILGHKYLAEVQKVRLNIEMFKNEVREIFDAINM